MSKRRILITLAISCLILTISMVTTVFADEMQIERVPITAFFGEYYFNSCYNDGEGENITDLTGVTQIGFKANNGGYVFHINGANGVGVGAISGDTYRITGGLQEVLANGGDSWTLIHNFLIASNDPSNTFHLTWRTHVTVTPSGQLIVNPDVDEIVCG
ncbi:MAG: hypothetical protein PVG33_06965 [Chloroflexota bacterium]|jgi:hypothetical protein